MALQIVRTAFLLFCLYLVFTPFWEIEYELVSFLCYLLMLPVIMIIPVIIICLTIGLPLRFGTLHEAWLRYQWIAAAGIAAGAVLFCSTVTPAYFPNVLMLAVGQRTGMPIHLLPTAGWFLFAFSSLHFYPRILINRRKRS